jgi:hypothetical protein
MTTKIPDRIAMTRDEVLALVRVEPVLQRLGLSLYCLRCHARGEKDGVRALNGPDDPELVVECGCMIRAYRQAQ